MTIVGYWLLFVLMVRPVTVIVQIYLACTVIIVIMTAIVIKNKEGG